MRKILAFGVLSASLAYPLATQAAQIWSRNIGAWTIAAFNNDSTGVFSHCVAAAPYKSGITMLLAIDSNLTWRMGFISPSWQLNRGASYPIAYQIDRGPVIRANADVRDSNFVTVELLDNERLFTSFRRGRLLTVEAAGELFYFDLTNSSQSLAAALECTLINRTSPSRNPFASKAEAPSATANNAALRIEAATFSANLLATAGIPAFKLIEELPPGYDNYHAVFTAPGVFGGMMILPNADITSATAALMATLSANCNGHLATASLPVNGQGTRIRVACQGSTGISRANYFMVPRPKGGVYAFELSQAETGSLPSEVPSTSIEDSAGKLMDASFSLTR